MATLAYRIIGVLENSSGGFLGMQINALWKDELFEVRVPITAFSEELIAYLRFRLMIPATPAIQRLPIKIQNLIRIPVDRHMGQWISDGHLR